MDRQNLSTCLHLIGRLLCAIAQYIKEYKIRGGKKCGGQVSVGVGVEAGPNLRLDLGQAEGPSAICRHGRDQGGCLVSEEDQAEVSDGLAINMFAHVSRGFRDGGGLI